MVNKQRPDDIVSDEPDVEGHFHAEDLGGFINGGKPVQKKDKVEED